MAAYDALLARDPKNEFVQAGRASVALFRRTDGIGSETGLRVAQAAPDDDAQLAVADLEVLADRVEEAVTRLIAQVRARPGTSATAFATSWSSCSPCSTRRNAGSPCGGRWRTRCSDSPPVHGC